MKMFVTGVFTALALACGVTLAFAGSSDWYVVLDTITKKCSITDTKPTSPTQKILADGKSFPSEEEATAVMQKTAECKAG